MFKRSYKIINLDVRHARRLRESKRQIVRSNEQAERSNFSAAPWTDILKLKLTYVQDSETSLLLKFFTIDKSLYFGLRRLNNNVLRLPCQSEQGDF